MVLKDVKSYIDNNKKIENLEIENILILTPILKESYASLNFTSSETL